MHLLVASFKDLLKFVDKLKGLSDWVLHVIILLPINYRIWLHHDFQQVEYHFFYFLGLEYFVYEVHNELNDLFGLTILPCLYALKQLSTQTVCK